MAFARDHDIKHWPTHSKKWNENFQGLSFYAKKLTVRHTTCKLLLVDLSARVACIAWSARAVATDFVTSRGLFVCWAHKWASQNRLQTFVSVRSGRCWGRPEQERAAGDGKCQRVLHGVDRIQLDAARRPTGRQTHRYILQQWVRYVFY